METHGTETGFTIVEVIVALIVMTIFVVLFFQLFLSNTSQRVATTRRATASDISDSNLRKITDHSTVLPSCTTNGSSQPINDMTDTTDPVPGSSLFSSGVSPESLTGTGLPAATTQTLLAFYPKGCSSNLILVKSTVGNFSTEDITHAAYFLK